METKRTVFKRRCTVEKIKLIIDENKQQKFQQGRKEKH